MVVALPMARHCCVVLALSSSLPSNPLPMIQGSGEMELRDGTQALATSFARCYSHVIGSRCVFMALESWILPMAGRRECGAWKRSGSGLKSCQQPIFRFLHCLLQGSSAAFHALQKAAKGDYSTPKSCWCLSCFSYDALCCSLCSWLLITPI